MEWPRVFCLLASAWASLTSDPLNEQRRNGPSAFLWGSVVEAGRAGLGTVKLCLCRAFRPVSPSSVDNEVGSLIGL